MFKKLFKKNKVEETPQGNLYIVQGLRGSIYVDNEESVEYLKREDIRDLVYIDLEVDELDSQSLLNLKELGINVEYHEDNELCLSLPENMLFIQSVKGAKGYFMLDRIVGMITGTEVVRFIQDPNKINLVVASEEFNMDKSVSLEVVGGLLAAVDYCDAIDYDEQANTIKITETDEWKLKFFDSAVSFTLVKNDDPLITVNTISHKNPPENGVIFRSNIVTHVKEIKRGERVSKRLSVYKRTAEGQKYIGGSFVRVPKEGEELRDTVEEALDRILPGFREEPYRYW